jgi:malonyl-CoA/methylmalonyl-CoA synthetase
VPHPDFGESVVAAVVLDKDGPDTDKNADTIAETIAATIEPHLARYKHPRRYIITDSLPRNTMGKVQKNVLRARYVP